MPIANGQRRRGAQQAVRSNRPRTHCAGRRQTAGGAVNGAAGGVVDDVIGSVGSVGSVGAQRRCAPTPPTPPPPTPHTVRRPVGGAQRRPWFVGRHRARDQIGHNQTDQRIVRDVGGACVGA